MKKIALFILLISLIITGYSVTKYYDGVNTDKITQEDIITLDYKNSNIPITEHSTIYYYFSSKKEITDLEFISLNGSLSKDNFSFNYYLLENKYQEPIKRNGMYFYCIYFSFDTFNSNHKMDRGFNIESIEVKLNNQNTFIFPINLFAYRIDTQKDNLGKIHWVMNSDSYNFYQGITVTSSDDVTINNIEYISTMYEMDDIDAKIGEDIEKYNNSLLLEKGNEIELYFNVKGFKKEIPYIYGESFVKITYDYNGNTGIFIDTWRGKYNFYTHLFEEFDDLTASK